MNMAELNDLERLTAVIEERVAGVCRKLDYVIELMNRNNDEHWRSIAEIKAEQASLKVKVYSIAAAVGIVPVLLAIAKFWR